MDGYPDLMPPPTQTRVRDQAWLADLQMEPRVSVKLFSISGPKTFNSCFRFLCAHKYFVISITVFGSMLKKQFEMI